MYDSKIDVYILDRNLVYVDILNQYKGIVFPKRLAAHSTFELYAPITDVNKEILKDGNIVYIDEDTAGVIENVKKTVNQNNEKIFEIKGRTLEFLLTTRIIWGTILLKNKRPDAIMMQIINDNCISPTNIARKIPQFENGAIDSGYDLSIIDSYQKTGGEVYDAVQSIADTYGIGFKVLIDVDAKKYVFKIIYGVDRTQNDNPIIFDTDMQQILDSEYVRISTDLKNVAYVQGQIEEATGDRKDTTSGDATSSGFDRRELYVDARDLSNKVTVDGEETTISDDEYIKLLGNRGDSKLADYIVTESFEMSLNVTNEMYLYGKDYFLGDKVKIFDNEIGIVTDAILTGIQRTWDGEKFVLKHTFGFSNMSLLRKVKRLIQ